jgi:hypothetical protein
MPEIQKTVTHFPRRDQEGPQPGQEGPQPGVAMNPQTGEAHVPTAEGVKVEVKADGTTHFLFPNTPAYVKLVDEIIKKEGLQLEAATARGQTYNPTTWTRVKNVFTTNASVGKVVVIMVAGYGIYRLGAWAGRRLAEYFGWNMFGNIVNEDEMFAGGNKNFDERQAPRRAPRRPSEPTQPTAAA